MEKEFDLLVFIGRFQPFHKGHEYVVLEALKKTKRLLILIGSPNISQSIRNPWSYEQRVNLIKFSNQEIHDRWYKGEVVFEPLNDAMYNDTAWIADVQAIVEDVVDHYPIVNPIGLVGFAKDHTSYYLKMFPSWGSLDIIPPYFFNATDIRNQYFRPAPQIPYGMCPENVVKFLEKFMLEKQFASLLHEANSIRAYKKAWSHSPFPPTFQCVDNVVIQSGHILLIERGEQPGKGLLALPGGFLDVDETLIQSAVRELKEETKISDHIGEIPPAKLRSFITKEETFDDPNRSTRGRTITKAYLYQLPNSNPLYSVVGSDDAKAAKWYPIGTVKSNLFFEDHYFIMQKMLGLSL